MFEKPPRTVDEKKYYFFSCSQFYEDFCLQKIKQKFDLNLDKETR